MNRDDILRMARDADLFEHVPLTGHVSFIYDLMEFAALVSAAERERFADECIDIVARWGGSVEIEAAIRARSST